LVSGREHSRVTIHHSPHQIDRYASLWGVADLNGDVVQAGAFADSLAKTGAEGVRMLNQHDARAPVGVWEHIVEDERGLFVRGRIEDWSAEARFAGALSRAGALDGLSIGYRTARARRQGRLRVLSAVELWEVSLVTFPMLPGARFSCCDRNAHDPCGGGLRVSGHQAV
jgi:HK97 family phage prohead protease